jgi:hypothetical protein
LHDAAGCIWIQERFAPIICQYNFTVDVLQAYLGRIVGLCPGKFDKIVKTTSIISAMKNTLAGLAGLGWCQHSHFVASPFRFFFKDA